jgi:hypothetical protein
MVSRLWPFETMVMAVLLAHEKRLGQRVRQIEELMAGHASCDRGHAWGVESQGGANPTAVRGG